VQGRRIGVLGMTFPDGRELGDEDSQLLLALARQCAQALDRARLYVAERAARAEAEQAQRLAEGANRAKSDFLATMSHELRTPLNAIAGYAELMEMGLRGPVTDVQREDLARIQKSQRHLLSLVNDVLNFARIDAGRVHYDLADVPLDEVLADVGPLVTPQLEAKGLAFETDGARDGAGPLTVRADREKVAQILLNLLSNAIKFTPSGGRVAVACDERDGKVLVRVTDTGIGIPEEQREAIFEPFVQVQRGLTRTAEGTGLGLAISRDLARAMGGDIEVESAPGAGSTFTLELPPGG
jgi:signal transduction histidine kinase